MNSIELNAKSGTTRILVAESFGQLPNLLDHRKVIVITDSNVGRLYEERLEDYEKVIIGIGEEGKTLTTVKSIYQKFLESKVDRTYFVLGVGGGIVTDVTGFSAATYMRGLQFGFVPTTLLGQVDASIGGKNGVNFNGFKNMIGTIKQPEFCLIDFTFLNTLPREEVISGMAEIMKCGVISDRNLFKHLENNHREIMSFRRPELEKAVTSAISVKVKTVKIDETENWERMKLNFGHTVGHAVEKVSKIPHGNAISIGMIAASRLSLSKGLLTIDEFERIKTLLVKLGLPVRIRADSEEVFQAISNDKKRRGGSINMVLLAGIGNATIIRTDKDELKGVLQEVCA